MKTAVHPTLKAHLWRLAIISLSLFGVHQDLQAKESSGMQWTVTRHTWGEDLSGSLQGAGGIGGLLSSTVDGSPTKNQEQRTTNGFHYDSNGNVILLTNAKAQETARYSYDAFGKTLTATGPAAEQNRYQFSTKPVEEESGMVYYGYRWYDPITGRWPSRDPIEERGGVNLQMAFGNSGPNLIDVHGLLICSWLISKAMNLYREYGQCTSCTQTNNCTHCCSLRRDLDLLSIVAGLGCDAIEVLIVSAGSLGIYGLIDAIMSLDLAIGLAEEAEQRYQDCVAGCLN